MKSLKTRDQGAARRRGAYAIGSRNAGHYQFYIRIVPADDTSAANYQSGDFGRSPFFGQFSGKLPLASTLYVWCQDRSTIGVEKLRVQNPYSGRAPAWVVARWRLTDKSNFQLAASRFQKDHFFDHII